MKQRIDIQVRQDALNFIRRVPMATDVTSPFIAKVIQVYSQRMTCDIETPDKQRIPNVPVLTKGGVIDGAPYGEIDLPALDDYVIVMHASYGQRHKIIVGTIIPYLATEFLKAPVNSANKQFLTTFLESNIPLEYRRVFKSGASVQVEQDGTIVVEAPDGTYIRLDVATKSFTVRDSNENSIESSSSTFRIVAAGAVRIEDGSGNVIETSATSVTINGNLEVLQ